jgi:hypothetical protein
VALRSQARRLLGLADTMSSRTLSKNGNRLERFEALLDTLPSGYVFDGEIVALDEDSSVEVQRALGFEKRTSDRHRLPPVIRFLGPEARITSSGDAALCRARFPA